MKINLPIDKEAADRALRAGYVPIELDDQLIGAFIGGKGLAAARQYLPMRVLQHPLIAPMLGKVIGDARKAITDEGHTPPDDESRGRDIPAYIAVLLGTLVAIGAEKTTIDVHTTGSSDGTTTITGGATRIRATEPEAEPAPAG